MSTLVLAIEAILVHFLLQETLKTKKPFNAVVLFRKFKSQFLSAKNNGYRVVREQRQGLLDGEDRASFEMDRMNSRGEKIEERAPQVLPFGQIWTSNVLWVLLTVAIFDFHMGAFNNLWMLFLGTARELIPGTEPIVPGNDPTRPPPGDPIKDPPILARGTALLQPRAIFKFASGLAFPTKTIGFALAVLGAIGVALQFLLYPWANARFGLMKSFQG